MSKALSILYRAICHFSMAFSGIILFFWLFMKETSCLNYERLNIFLIFALIFGISSVIFSIPKLAKPILIAIHFIVNMVAFFRTFIMIDGVTQARAFIAVIFFVIVYAVVLLLSLLLKKLASKPRKTQEVDDTDNT